MNILEDVRFMSPLSHQKVVGDDTIVYRGWYKVTHPEFETASTADQKGEEKFRICRITTTAAGESTTEWADGDFNYDNEWDERENLTYSFIKN